MSVTSLADVPNTVHTLLFVKDSANLTELKTLGIRIDSTGGNVISAEVPVSKLAELSRWPSLIYAEAGRKAKPLLNRSIPLIRADEARTAFDRTGKGVLVGLVDTGIDIFHPDFRTAEGKTRIKYLWDQTDNAGTAPSGFGYGREYSEAQINDILSAQGNFPAEDGEGHGTLVTGIAAGSGGGTPYVGVAPEADLIVVKWLGDRGLDANRYLFLKAEVLKQPVVVNNSWGGLNGPHDGTDNESRGLSGLVGEGKPGRVITFAAGNNGDSPIHFGGGLKQDESGEIYVYAPDGQQEIEVEVWADARARYSFELKYPTDLSDTNRSGVEVQSGGIRTVDLPDDPSQPYGRASVTLDARDSPYPPNPSLQRLLAYVNLKNSSGGTLKGLNWSLALRRLNGDGSGQVDGWLTLGYDRMRFSETGPLIAGDNAKTLVNQACIPDVIAVGSFISTLEWTAPDGSTFKDPLDRQVGDLSPWSAFGPTRDGRKKPEVSAPGQWVASSLSSAAARNLPLGSEKYVTPDGKHFYGEGTSLASPHVAGTVALMLQSDPTLDAHEVREILTESAVTPYTDWNPQLGYGKLDAYNALRRATVPQSVLPGDLNRDGDIDLWDAVIVMKMAVGMTPTTAEDLEIGDVAPAAGPDHPTRGDGQITVEDAVRILRRIIGLEGDPWP